MHNNSAVSSLSLLILSFCYSPFYIKKTMLTVLLTSLLIILMYGFRLVYVVAHGLYKSVKVYLPLQSDNCKRRYGSVLLFRSLIYSPFLCVICLNFEHKNSTLYGCKRCFWFAFGYVVVLRGYFFKSASSFCNASIFACISFSFNAFSSSTHSIISDG